MAINYNALSVFSVEGCRFRRINPDGTQPKITRTVGGAGPFDCSDVTSVAAVPLIFKINNGAAESVDVDLSGLAVADINAVTVDELVAAINTAAPTDITASKEAVTGYLKLAHDSLSTGYLQVYGELAGYVQIGGTKAGSTLGTKFLKYFDGTLSISEAKNVKEGEEIEQETGDGTLRSVVTDDILKGENPVITVSQNDYELKELIMGGVYNATGREYTPRLTSDTTQPRFYIETFAAMYSKGTNKVADKQAYEMKKYFSAVGVEADVSKETKAWAPYAYNCKATESNDENGVKIASFIPKQLTLAEFTALDVTNV